MKLYLVKNRRYTFLVHPNKLDEFLAEFDPAENVEVKEIILIDYEEI